MHNIHTGGREVWRKFKFSPPALHKIKNIAIDTAIEWIYGWWNYSNAYNVCCISSMRYRYTAIANKVCVAKNLDFVFFSLAAALIIVHVSFLYFFILKVHFLIHIYGYTWTVIRGIFAFMFRHFFYRAFSFISSNHQYESISDISCFKFIRHSFICFNGSTHWSADSQYVHSGQTFTSKSCKIWLWMWQSPSLALFYWSYLYWSMCFD